MGIEGARTEADGALRDLPVATARHQSQEQQHQQPAEVAPTGTAPIATRTRSKTKSTSAASASSSTAISQAPSRNSSGSSSRPQAPGAVPANALPARVAPHPQPHQAMEGNNHAHGAAGTGGTDKALAAPTGLAGNALASSLLSGNDHPSRAVGHTSSRPPRSTSSNRPAPGSTAGGGAHLEQRGLAAAALTPAPNIHQGLSSMGGKSLWERPLDNTAGRTLVAAAAPGAADAPVVPGTGPGGQQAAAAAVAAAGGGRPSQPLDGTASGMQPLQPAVRAAAVEVGHHRHTSSSSSSGGPGSGYGEDTKGSGSVQVHGGPQAKQGAAQQQGAGGVPGTSPILPAWPDSGGPRGSTMPSPPAAAASPAAAAAASPNTVGRQLQELDRLRMVLRALASNDKQAGVVLMAIAEGKAPVELLDNWFAAGRVQVCDASTSPTPPLLPQQHSAPGTALEPPHASTSPTAAASLAAAPRTAAASTAVPMGGAAAAAAPCQAATLADSAAADPAAPAAATSGGGAAVGGHPATAGRSSAAAGAAAAVVPPDAPATGAGGTAPGDGSSGAEPIPFHRGQQLTVVVMRPSLNPVEPRVHVMVEVEGQLGCGAMAEALRVRVTAVEGSVAAEGGHLSSAVQPGAVFALKVMYRYKDLPAHWRPDNPGVWVLAMSNQVYREWRTLLKCKDSEFVIRGHQLGIVVPGVHLPSSCSSDEMGPCTPCDIELERACLLLEVAEGGSLGKCVGQQGLREEKVQVVISRVARGLAYAASAGSMHRDLKPDNVLLLRRLPNNQPDLHSAVVGTPAYATPDMQPGREHTAKVDVCLLGYLTLHLLTGQWPFEYLGDPLNPEVLARRTPEELVHPNSTYMRRRCWETALGKQCLEFLQKAIRVDPQQRPSMRKLLKHSTYLKERDKEGVPL